ncbi:MAG TPA: MFS transporter [Thermoleophilia bacterium]|nr:MFS transporter [Thermoleophilia bacterium]
MSASSEPPPTARAPLFALSLGHGCADLSSSALFALLPFLLVERHYSFAAAGVFALTAEVAAAVFQPLLGAHGDRRAGFWLMPVGLVLAGLGIAAVGLVEGYAATLAAVVVTSAGSAAYHPEGARWARRISSGRVNADMGVFSLGGSLGYALGPLVVTAALVPLGMSGTLVIQIAPFAAAVAILLVLRDRRRELTAAAQAARAVVARASRWGPFVRLLVFTSVASSVQTALLTYVPLFLVDERGTSPGASNVASSVLLAAAAGGTLLGGLVAQRHGRRLALIVPQLVLVPLIAAMPALGFVAILPVVALAGLAMNAYISVTLVLAQEYLPAHMGLATGLTVGLTSGAAGLVVTALGLLGDRAGAGAVILAIAPLALLGAGLGALLPEHSSPAMETRAPGAA